MTEEQIRKMLDDGEGFTVEYKECVNALNDSVFETVASFSNRYGGYILLGVKEVNNKGVVIGVNRNAAPSMKKNFINMLNNPNKIVPSLYLILEEFEIDGNRYTKVYCGGEPDLEEGDIFRTFVPLKTDEQGTVNRYKLTDRQQKILDEIQANPAMQVEELIEKLSVSRSTVMRGIQEIKKSIPLYYDKKIQRWILH